MHEQRNGTIDTITDAEVSAAIRYLDWERTAEMSSPELLVAIVDLDPDVCETSDCKTHGNLMGFYVFLVILTLYFSALGWIYFQLR